MKTMYKTSIPSKVIRDSKKGQRIMDLIGAALNKVGLDEDQGQWLIENPEFPTAIKATLRAYAIPHQYVDEEVVSNHGYLSGYCEATPIAEQMCIIRKFFPNLGDPDEAIATQEHPANSEGYFAIPRWQLIASTYSEAVEKVLDALKKQREGLLAIHCKGELGPDRFRETDRKRLAFERLATEQKGRDTLIVAAQFGFYHRGRSVRRARVVMHGMVFGLGAFEIGILLLTHSVRLQHDDDLNIDCAGDEHSSSTEHQFDEAPCFSSSNDGWLGFGMVRVSRVSYDCGSASGFLPPAPTEQSEAGQSVEN
ncbi:MAG: hypothetical protein V1916_01060 [Patescibacteria group bacterium]